MLRERQFFIFIVTASGLHLASADALALRGETVPHVFCTAEPERFEVCGYSPPFEGWNCFLSLNRRDGSAFTAGKALCLLFSKLYIPGTTGKSQAFLIAAGATAHTIPPRFPTGIGFDPCSTSERPSRGREGCLTATTPTDLLAIKD